MQSALRILYFSRGFTTHDQRFLTSLSKTDHEVLFLRLENKYSNSVEETLHDSIKILPVLNQNKNFYYVNTISNLIRLRRIIQKFKPDLVHAGPIQSCAFLIAIAGFSPLITMSWGSDILVDSEKNLLFKAVTKFTLKKSAHFLGDCNTVKNKAKELGFPEEKITIFPWGIDLEKFHPGENQSLRSKLGWNEKFILLSLRSWEDIYGVDILVKGFIEASKVIPGLRLILLGDGSQREHLKELISDAKISDKVFFGGIISQSELPQYYQAANLYLSASFSDGSSVSLMEALGCGLPVLVSDLPSNQEWIKDAENGWLFKTGSVEDLKLKILDVYKNQNKLLIICKQARLTAEKKANWNENFKKLLEAYNSAVKS